MGVFLSFKKNLQKFETDKVDMIASARDLKKSIKKEIIHNIYIRDNKNDFFPLCPNIIVLGGFLSFKKNVQKFETDKVDITKE